MHKAIIIDDEKHCVDSLSLLLKTYCPEIQLMEKCRSAKKGLEAIHKFNPDLVFLDIEMPVMNGFDLLAQFTTIPFAIIFTTSYDQYAIKAIRFSALDYLLKPIDPDELITAVRKVKEQPILPITAQFEVLLKQVQNKNSGINKIAVPTSDGFELLHADQVMYCKANDNYTWLYLKNKSKLLVCRNLKDIEEQLEDFPSFIRVHNSYVVNINEVTKYVRGEGGYLIMSDGYTINVSRHRKDDLLRLF